MFALLAFACLCAAPVWLVAVVVKFVSLARPGRRADWPAHLLRWCAGMAAAAAAGLYVIALGAVQMAAHESESGTDSSPAPACRQALPDAVGHISGHRTSSFPPGFGCVLDDGTVRPSSSGYARTTVVVAVVGAGAVVLWGAGRFAAGRRAPAGRDGGAGDSDALARGGRAGRP